jgi:hypothetical protein
LFDAIEMKMFIEAQRCQIRTHCHFDQKEKSILELGAGAFAADLPVFVYGSLRPAD